MTELLINWLSFFDVGLSYLCMHEQFNGVSFKQMIANGKILVTRVGEIKADYVRSISTVHKCAYVHSINTENTHKTSFRS